LESVGVPDFLVFFFEGCGARGVPTVIELKAIRIEVEVSDRVRTKILSEEKLIGPAVSGRQNQEPHASGDVPGHGCACVAASLPQTK